MDFSLQNYYLIINNDCVTICNRDTLYTEYQDNVNSIITLINFTEGNTIQQVHHKLKTYYDICKSMVFNNSNYIDLEELTKQRNLLFLELAEMIEKVHPFFINYSYYYLYEIIVKHLYYTLSDRLFSHYYAMINFQNDSNNNNESLIKSLYNAELKFINKEKSNKTRPYGIPPNKLIKEYIITKEKIDTLFSSDYWKKELLLFKTSVNPFYNINNKKSSSYKFYFTANTIEEFTTYYQKEIHRIYNSWIDHYITTKHADPLRHYYNPCSEKEEPFYELNQLQTFIHTFFQMVYFPQTEQLKKLSLVQRKSLFIFCNKSISSHLEQLQVIPSYTFLEKCVQVNICNEESIIAQDGLSKRILDTLLYDYTIIDNKFLNKIISWSKNTWNPNLKVYRYDHIEDILYLELFLLLDSHMIIKQCPLCNYYFIPLTGKYKYCSSCNSRAISGITTAPQKAYIKNLKADIGKRSYHKYYNRYFKQKERGKISESQWNTWRDIVCEDYKKYREGLIEVSDFIDRLDSSKKYLDA